MSLDFQPIVVPRDSALLVEFLSNDEWPFHGRQLLTVHDIEAMDFASADTASFWAMDDDERVGLVRALDLGDIGEGAPQLDFRVATAHRGRGVGTRTAQWIVQHLFDSYPELHRVEANTRHDNLAMQRVLSKAGFTLEGQLREGWSSSDGQRYDTMVYGLLRSDR